jgi:hypothetical protein
MKMLSRRACLAAVGVSVLCIQTAACGNGESATGTSTNTSMGAGGGTGTSTSTSTGSGSAAMPHTLYVAHEGSLGAYDIATGAEIEGSIPNISDPKFMQALDDGTVIVNNSNKDQILVVNGRPATEIKRFPSSSQGGKKPNDSYISPVYNGKTYWLTLNDGTTTAETSSATFVDITPDSATRFQPLGEVRAGIGHHQASFSTTRERMVVSNLFDCDNVLSVYDFSDMKNIKVLETLTAAEAGLDGSTMEKTCDPTESAGVAPRPHGCATSKANGKIYCNVTGPGVIAVIDPDADPPAFKMLPTTGKGGGYTKSSDGGKFIYAVQALPREGKGGADCQIGQLLTIDATSESIVGEIPLFYKGPGCKDVLVGTDEETANPNRIRTSLDGKTMFIALSGGFLNGAARVRQHLVLDISNPGAPVQLPSIPVGTSTGDRASEISGDGKWLFVADVIDGTVTQIDIAARTVARTLTVKANPLMISTYGTVEGPSLQVGPVY